MHRLSLVGFTLGLGCQLARASTSLLWGATIIAFDEDNESLRVIRNGSILIKDDRIAAVNTDPLPSGLPNGTTLIDVSEQIITPGFVNTHTHNWQTAFKTIASNTTLAEYFGRYGEFAAAGSFTAEDVYLGQLTGLFEGLNGGVTTLLDHAHHTWSNETAYAGLHASIESGARVFWAYTFHDLPPINYTIYDQFPNFREIAESDILEGTPVELGISFDYWGPEAAPEAEDIASLIREYNVSVLTTHTLGGPWGVTNFPSEVDAFHALNGTTPVVFSHAAYITPGETTLLQSTGQYISITPESEMHYGHGHANAYYVQHQASLGTDTHFTFSADLLTQARLWLQETRLHFYNDVLEDWNIPTRNPMSAYQAFMLATRAGGQALRRPDLGVISVGAKADLVVWDAQNSPSLLGWVDPVAAVILHASVGDVLHVLVDGKFVKRDGRLVNPNYGKIRKDFVQSARRIQSTYLDMPYPVLEGDWPFSGYPLAAPHIVQIGPGKETGYGQQFLEV